MDAFRRLRSRRKSKGQADSFTSYADAESNYNRSVSSAWQTATTRSSVTVSRPSDAEKKFSHDQVRQPISPVETQRSPDQGSANRIQPLLVSISRPSIGSRPNTSGSFQNAVDRAADSVTQQPRALSPSSQLGLRGNRYIDIFSISGQSAKPTTTFNEDVAERNLDTIALTIEEQHYSYSPSSKYQEEVAARNAPQMTSSRSTSVQRKPDSNNAEHPRDLSMSPNSGSYKRHGRSEVESTRNKHLQDPTAYHSRQSSSRARDPPDPLPAIPQERSSDDFEHKDSISRARVQEAEMEMEKAKARWLQVRRGNHASSSPNTDKPLPASPPHKEPVNDRNTPLRSNPVKPVSDAPERELPRLSESAQREPYHDDVQEVQKPKKYKQDNLRSNVYKPDRRSANTAVTNSSEESRMRSDVSSGHYERQSYASDQSRHTQARRPSATSTNSYRRVMLGNRTIMDLTAEDDGEATSVASYLQTPVLENARADAFQKAFPLVVDHHSPPSKTVQPDSAVPNARWSSALEPVLDLDQLARRSQIISDTARAAAAARSLSKATESPRAVNTPPPSLTFSPIQTMTGSPPVKAITFSTISTLTSITPRSSQEILATNQSELPAEEGVVRQATSRDRLVILRTDSKSERSTTKTPANTAPLARVFADSQLEGSSAKLTSENLGIVRTGSNDQKSSTEKSDVAKRNERRREKLARAEAIREAAKKKIPAGPLDQEPMPGVKTRDFALTPLEKPTNKRIEALSERKKSQTELKKSSSSSSKSSSSERKSRSRSSKATNKVTFNENPVTNSTPQSERRSGKKSSKSVPNSTRKSRPISVFDEEAFRKKHAEANAALLRLQQSLQQSLEEDSSQAETPQETNTPVGRALSPVDRAAHGKSPAGQSASAAAIAMITAATSSPQPQARPKPITSNSSSSGQNTTKPPVTPTKTEHASPATRTTTLNRPNAATLNPLLSHLDSDKPPPSPGEVSLSSFPIPTPRTLSPELSKSPPAYVKDVGVPVRRGSQASRVSTASAFSIPFTMVPNRLGSLPENRNPPPGPPNPHQMQSIDSIIPPAHPVSSM